MVKDKELTYDDYYKASLDLISKIFGEEVLEKMKAQKIVSFDWDGIDITSGELLVTCPTIKQRFSKGYLYTDDDILQVFINSVFQYGFDQCVHTKLKPLEKQYKFLMAGFDEVMERKIELREELRLYKEKFGEL